MTSVLVSHDEANFIATFVENRVNVWPPVCAVAVSIGEDFNSALLKS